MNKLLEVCEFESITCNEIYKNYGTFKYLEKELFIELEDFILTSQHNNGSEAMDFLKISSKQNVGKVIQARNYVGIIQMKKGFQVQILPKIANVSCIDETKKILIQMLCSLRNFPSKVFNYASLKMDKMNIYEVFINMYIQEVRNLVKKGIKSAYLPIEENINFYKGKLLVQEHIKRNLIHKERFYVGYDEFGENRPVNRLIKATLIKLQNISSSATNIKEIRQLLMSFEMVNPSTNYVGDFSKVIIDRNTKDYEVLMIWSKVFLMNQSFTTFSGDTTAKTLLFPMEKVFESFVAKKLNKALRDKNCEISLQDKGYYLFDNPNKFLLKPDIVITQGKDRKIVLDTKWKILDHSQKQNYGISQSDMYQMYAYSKKYNASEIWMLYPSNGDRIGIEPETIKFASKDNVVVKLFFVDLKNIEENMKKLVKLLEL